MGSIVTVRNVNIGEGIPKICVSLIGSSNEKIREEIKSLQDLKVDIVEWRMDYHKDVRNIDKMKKTLEIIRIKLGERALLVTFRSKREGGEQEVEDQYYIELNKMMIETGYIDLIDVELFKGKKIVKEVVESAHQHHVNVIMSNHDFDKTPESAELISRLCSMQQMNADILKVAVMPHNVEDVLKLLTVTHEMFEKYADRPVVTMSMGKLGMVSRVVGETFGSAMTFGAVNEVSAPGQIEVSKLAGILQTFHENI